MLDIPAQTINSWRNRGLIPQFGEYRGEKVARHYGLTEMIALTIMRDLTAGPAGISATLAAEVGLQCVDVFLAGRLGMVPPDMFMVIEAGAGDAIVTPISAGDFPEYVAGWRHSSRKTKRTRLEVLDIRHVALRVSAKLTRYDDPVLQAQHTEEEVMALIEPVFERRMKQHLIEKEVHRFRNSRTSDLELAS
jgi:hypothetical protein